MANGYKSFTKGISLVPNSTQNNTEVGDVEFVNDKLQIHTAAIGQDAVVTENNQQTLTNKNLQDLTFKIVGNADVTKRIGWAVTAATTGKTLTIASAHTDNRTITLPDATDTLVGQNTTDTLTNKTLTAPKIDTAYGVGLADLNIGSDLSMNTGKNVKLNNNGQTVTVGASPTASASYPITLPAAAPTANTALVWDGTAYKWGAAGGADSSGANDDILATAFRARILDTFDDAFSLSSSTINSATTTAVHVPANQLYAIQYSNTTISSANTTTPSLAASPGFLAVGDVIIVGTEVRRVTALSPLTIESAFSVASGSCTVSQTVSSKELYGSAFDGASISSAFGGSSFSEYLVDYQDSVNTIFTPNINPLIAYSASQDGTTWSAVAARPVNQTDQIQSATFASPSTGLYVRLFSNVTVGSGTVNLLEYRAYMQKSPTVSSGVLNTAYARLDGSTTPQNCSLSVVGGKTRVTLTWPYSNSVNNPSAYGAIDVYVNGQFIPRQVGSYLTTGAFYTEISNTVIELDTNYSTTPYAIQVVQRQPMGNFTSSSGGSSSTAGSGLKNYLTTYGNNPGNGNFETGDTSGWGLFNTTLTSLIPTGAITSGASSIGTFSATATIPLAGTYSLLVGTSTGFTAGQGFISNAFTIDREDRAKVLTFNFSYEVVSGTGMNFSGTSANTWAIYLHDGTNWIQPAGVYGMVQSSGTGYVTGTFQTGSTATQYRLAVVCINAPSAGTYSLEFDDFFVGPQVSVNAPAMSDWQSYTPTGSWTSFTAYTGRWRRVGDKAEYKINVQTSGIPTAATLTINLFPGHVIDTNKLPSPSPSVDTTTLGFGSAVDSGIRKYGISVGYNNTTSITPMNTEPGTGANAISNTVPFSFNTGDSLDLEFSVPIAGWSSNTVASNDTDTRVVDLIVNDATTIFPTGTITNNFSTATTVNWNRSPVKDSHGTYSTGSYTVPISGDYFVTSSAEISHTASTGTFVGGYIMVNGSVRLADARKPTSPNAYVSVNGLIANLKAGDIITVRYASDATSPAFTNSIVNNFTVSRISGPAVVQATETVACSYYASAGGTSSTTSPINFDTREYDTHNAVTASPAGSGAWRFTAPVSGTYLVTLFSNQAASTQSTFYNIYKNSTTTAYKPITYCPSTVGLVTGSTSLKLNAGDYIGIYTHIAQNYQGNAALNSSGTSQITITRTGN